MNFNKVIILGNLTRDPEVRTLPSGQPLVTFGMATNRFYSDKDGNKQQAVEYHNIVAFGKLADICSRYLSKGKLVLVEGRLQTRNWQGQDGVKRYRTEIIMENMQLGPRVETAVSESTAPQSPPEEEIPVIEQEPLEEKEIKVENIPF